MSYSQRRVNSAGKSIAAQPSSYADDRVYLHVLGFPADAKGGPFKFKLSLTSPFKSLFRSLPIEMYRPSHSPRGLAPVISWSGLPLHEDMTPVSAGMRPGEANAVILEVKYHSDQQHQGSGNNRRGLSAAGLVAAGAVSQTRLAVRSPSRHDDDDDHRDNEGDSYTKSRRHNRLDARSHSSMPSHTQSTVPASRQRSPSAKMMNTITSVFSPGPTLTTSRSAAQTASLYPRKVDVSQTAPSRFVAPVVAAPAQRYSESGALVSTPRRGQHRASSPSYSPLPSNSNTAHSLLLIGNGTENRKMATTSPRHQPANGYFGGGGMPVLYSTSSYQQDTSSIDYPQLETDVTVAYSALTNRGNTNNAAVGALPRADEDRHVVRSSPQRRLLSPKMGYVPPPAPHNQDVLVAAETESRRIAQLGMQRTNTTSPQRAVQRRIEVLPIAAPNSPVATANQPTSPPRVIVVDSRNAAGASSPPRTFAPSPSRQAASPMRQPITPVAVIAPAASSSADKTSSPMRPTVSYSAAAAAPNSDNAFIVRLREQTDALRSAKTELSEKDRVIESLTLALVQQQEVLKRLDHLENDRRAREEDEVNRRLELAARSRAIQAAEEEAKRSTVLSSPRSRDQQRALLPPPRQSSGDRSPSNRIAAQTPTAMPSESPRKNLSPSRPRASSPLAITPLPPHRNGLFVEQFLSREGPTRGMANFVPTPQTNRERSQGSEMHQMAVASSTIAAQAAFVRRSASMNGQGAAVPAPTSAAASAYQQRHRSPSAQSQISSALVLPASDYSASVTPTASNAATATAAIHTRLRSANAENESLKYELLSKDGALSEAAEKNARLAKQMASGIEKLETLRRENARLAAELEDKRRVRGTLPQSSPIISGSGVGEGIGVSGAVAAFVDYSPQSTATLLGTGSYSASAPSNYQPQQQSTPAAPRNSHLPTSKSYQSERWLVEGMANATIEAPGASVSHSSSTYRGDSSYNRANASRPGLATIIGTPNRLQR